MQFRTPTRLAAPLAVAALVAVGCSSEDLMERGLEEAIERSAEREGVGDVDIDLDLDLDGDGGGNFSMSVDGAEAQLGNDLDVPAWVPGGFPLPDDLNISMAVVEDGTSTFTGSSSAPAAPLRDAIMGWLASNGFEVLTDTSGDERFNFVAVKGDDVLEGNHGFGGFTLSASQRDVTFERQDAAPLREGPGTATIRVGTIDAQLDGTCRIQGRDYSFETFGTETTANMSVYAVAADQQPQGTAFVMTLDVESNEFTQYSINYPMGNDDEPQVTIAESSFGVSGSWFDMIGGEPVQGTMAVTCDQ